MKFTVFGSKGYLGSSFTKYWKSQNIECVTPDIRNEKIGYKIREHSIQKVPYLVVIGDREVEKRQVTVLTQKGEDLGSMSIDDFIKYLSKNIKSKA